MKSYIENGRTKYEADRAGDILRVFAVMGCDIVKSTGPTTRTWAAHLDGQYKGCVMESDSVPGFAYGFTAIS